MTFALSLPLRLLISTILVYIKCLECFTHVKHMSDGHGPIALLACDVLLSISYELVNNFYVKVLHFFKF